MKTYFKILKVIIFSAVIIYLLKLMSGISRDELSKALGHFSFVWFLLGLSSIICNFALSALRFKLAGKHSVPYTEIFVIVLTSFLLNFASMIQGVGVGAKLALMKTKGVKITHSSASVWLEILFDVTFCGLAALVILFSFNQKGLGQHLELGWALLLIFLVLVIVSAFSAKYFQFIREFISELKTLVTVKRCFALLLTTAAIWLSAASSFYFLLKAFGGSYIVEFTNSFLAVTAGLIAGLASLIPGGLGVREVVWSGIASGIEYPLTLAALVAVLMRIISICTALSIIAIKKYI
jgi:uncharacterized membrane protein YbhN (UPF0104 family)